MTLHLDFKDSLAEWSKALAQGASPQGRGLEPHSCHFCKVAGKKTAETGWPEPQQNGLTLVGGSAFGKQKLHVDFHLFFHAVVCRKIVCRLYLHRITSTVIPLAYTTVFRTPHSRRG